MKDAYPDNMPNIFTTKNLILAVIVLVLVGGGIIWYLTLPRGADEEKGEGGFFSNLFPSGPERNIPEGEPAPPTPSPVESQNSSQLIREAVSGATLVKGLPAQAGKIRYIEKSSGHVYEMGLDGQNKQRISNTTIPGIFEVLWSSSGNRAILKYLSNGNLSILSANFTGSSTQGVFLPSDIKDVAFSPKGDRIIYTISSGGEGLVVTATPENKTQIVRLRTPYTSWKILWPEENNIYLLSAPSAFLDGFLYRLNLSSTSFIKIAGPLPGLLASTNQSFLLFSAFDSEIKTLGTSLMNISKNSANLLDLKIIPEKCVWSKKSKNIVFCAIPAPLPSGNYPDDWYKGKISFNDVILKLDASTISTSYTLLPANIDAAQLFLSEDETILLFINKKDGSLWRTKLE